MNPYILKQATLLVDETKVHDRMAVMGGRACLAKALFTVGMALL